MDYILLHHGIKGQKWGVRRYQNEDGSLTSAGENRYRISKKYERYGGNYTKKGLERYKSRADAYEEAKKKYKEGEINRFSLKTAKYNAKKSKRDLKNDYLADQGKELYKQGKRVRAFNNQRAILGAVPAFMAGKVGYAVASKFMSHRAAGFTAGSITAGIMAANIALASIGNYRARRLRAYYGH